MATNTLTLGVNTIQCGLGTQTYTVPATLPPNNVSVTNVIFNVQCQVTVPSAVAGGNGTGGAGKDGGLGALGGFSGAGTNAQLGLGQGAKGLGFGGTVLDGATLTSPPASPTETSGLTITVTQNGTTKYTAPTFAVYQSALQFRIPLQCSSGDVINVVLASSTASDETLNAIQANISIGTGM